MKTTLNLILIAVLLAGCSIQPAKFESAEYSLYVSLMQQTNQLYASCGKPLIEQSYLEQLATTADRLQIYVAHRPDNFSKHYANSVQELLLKIHSGGSLSYCKASAENLTAVLSRILDTIGSRGE